MLMLKDLTGLLGSRTCKIHFSDFQSNLSVQITVFKLEFDLF